MKDNFSSRRKNTRRGPDGRFGTQHYFGRTPSENFDWDDAIIRLRRMLEDLDRKQNRKTRF